MSECLAARVDDEIAHTASKGWMIAGLVGGAILGAAAVVVTGGTALVAVSAVAAGACAAGGLGELLGSMSWAPRHTTGTLNNGLPLSVIFGLHIMNNMTALNYVEKALTLAKKRYAEVKNLNPHAPLLQMYDSIIQQLLFLRDLIEGKEKDKAKLWKMTFGMYAVKEFDNSDELFFERLSDAWFIVDQIRRGLKVRLPHEVNANYKIKQQKLKMKCPDEF